MTALLRSSREVLAVVRNVVLSDAVVGAHAKLPERRLVGGLSDNAVGVDVDRALVEQNVVIGAQAEQVLEVVRAVVRDAQDRSLGRQPRACCRLVLLEGCWLVCQALDRLLRHCDQPGKGASRLPERCRVCGLFRDSQFLLKSLAGSRTVGNFYCGCA